MNIKQTAPIAVTLAPLIAAMPQLLIVGGIIAFGIYLLSDDDKKPDSASVPSAPERPKIQHPPYSESSFPANSGCKIAEKPEIPAYSAGNLTLTHVTLAPVPVMSVPAIHISPVTPPPTNPVTEIQPVFPRLERKKMISRNDMAKVFNGGRGLTRKAAVTALKTLGFGKTAAYEALEMGGRFAPLLEFSQDETISWKS